MDREKVLKLAKLARIEIGDEEVESLSKEFDAILGYIGEIKEVDKFNKLDKLKKEEFATKNIMREDANPHESGLYTEKLLTEAPAREGDYFKVKKIL